MTTYEAVTCHYCQGRCGTLMDGRWYACGACKGQGILMRATDEPPEGRDSST